MQTCAKSCPENFQACVLSSFHLKEERKGTFSDRRTSLYAPTQKVLKIKDYVCTFFLLSLEMRHLTCAGVPRKD